MVKLRREVRQNIRAFLLRNGLEEPSALDAWGAAPLHALQAMPLPRYLRHSLDSYLEEHTNILGALAKITRQLEDAVIECGHGERIKNLRTIPGVGVTIAHRITGMLNFLRLQQHTLFTTL